MNQFNGRNILSIINNDNKKYFRKEIINDEDSIRKDNLLFFNQFIQDNNIKINTPTLISHNENIFLYEYIENSYDLQYLLSKKDISKIFQNIEQGILQLIKLHNIEVQNYDIKNNYILPVIPLIGLTSNEFAQCSGAEIELFSLLQHDSQLIETIKDIYNNKFEIEKSYIHGDMRLDQFLLDDKNNTWILDFEEFCIGDFHKDIAGIIGSIIFNDLLNTFSDVISNEYEQKSIHYGFMKRGYEYLSKSKFYINEIIRIYNINSKNKINNQLLSIYVGWFLIERVISRSKLTYKLSEKDKSILGIGRNLIVNFKEFSY